MIVLLLIAFAVIAWLEVPGLVKKKMWRELVVFSIYLSVGMALSIPQVLGISPPNPGIAIESIYEPLFEMFLK